MVGSLDDLRPDKDAAPFVDPDHPDEAEVADAAVEAITGLLKEAARLREVEDSLRRDLDAMGGERDQAWAAAGHRRVYRAKQRLVRTADHNRLARARLGFYRRVRGRSSRSA